ncbi:hypothetical protein C5Y96_11915 [Blastopirellula marina]|uniref:Uncharacterized protein n=1 Tax=Blastopirellula marina TaxID=124 RepID=A0A2S8FFW5_9BACT|nr:MULTISPECIES: hypothetical protein [Pirellulaceae]PQO31059.1 hypothetical protein C5Y96_11915 [Blastopirellula marina]RCS51453.1 hypothetical protein DTL36_11925 [Bremerella cremea]
MLGRRLLLLALIVLATPQAARADEPKLRDRLTIPKQGHLELQRALIADLDGVQLKAVADVVKLRDQLEAIPYDREAVLKWKFLDQLGFTVVKHEIPPSPPGVKIELIQGPAWTTTIYDYNNETFVDRTSYNTTEHIHARSPVSEVSLQRNGDEQSIEHRAPRPQLAGSFNPAEVLGRSTRSLDRPYVLREAGGKTFHVIDFPQFENWLWVDPRQDAILAVATVDKKTNRVFGCTLFLHLQQPSDRCRFPMPRLILDFSMLSEDVCHVTMYHFDQADFETPIKPEQLQVPVKEGAMYAYKTADLDFQRRLPFDVDDLLNLFPESVQKMIQSQ